MPEKQATSSAKEQLPLEEQAQTPKLYTEEQMREIYNESQRSGYIAAIKNIRSNINDYLDSLIVAASMNQGKGE
jgi:hypothetical protein